MSKWFIPVLILSVLLLFTFCGKKEQPKVTPKVESEVQIIKGNGDDIPTKIMVKNTSSFPWHNVKMSYNNKFILSTIIDDSNPNSIVYGSKTIPVVQPGETTETAQWDFRSEKGGTSGEDIFGLTIQTDEGLSVKRF
jgi:hypothetical protein